MVVNEGLEVARPQPGMPESEITAPESIPARPQQEVRTPGISWLRLAYAFEFLIALIATFILWSEVGGQGHLDLIPWYTKLILGLAMAWSSVRFTAGLAEESRVWNSRTRRWFSSLLVVALAMAGITYYYHLHEAPDQPDTDETTATSVSLERPTLPLSRTSDRTGH